MFHEIFECKSTIWFRFSGLKIYFIPFHSICETRFSCNLWEGRQKATFSFQMWRLCFWIITIQNEFHVKNISFSWDPKCQTWSYVCKIISIWCHLVDNTMINPSKYLNSDRFIAFWKSSQMSWWITLTPPCFSLCTSGM